MLRKIGFTLLCAVAAISTPAYSITTHYLQPGLTLEYELVPQTPQFFVNFMFWAVEANCKITTTDESDDLFAEVITKKAKINGQNYNEGQTIIVPVKPDQNLRIGADPGAKVRITNLGNSLVKATCST